MVTTTSRLRPETTRFIVLGGGTVVIAAVLAALELAGLTQGSSSVTMARIGTFFAFAAWIVNYPHAVWSYRLAYGQGESFVLKNKGTLLILPLLMLAGLVFVHFNWNLSTEGVPLLSALDGWFNSIGVFLSLTSYRSVGSLALAFMLIAQMVFLGQHYAMQSYGVTLHCARVREYPLDDRQRRWIRLSLISMWAVNALAGYTYLSVINSSGFQYFTPRFPDLLRSIAEATFAVSFIGVIYAVVYKNWRAHRRLPPPGAWGAYVGLLLWLQPYWYFAYGYHLWVIQFGHCAQYLYFVVLVENSGFMGAKIRRSLPMVAGLTGIILLMGYLGFEWIPGRLDRTVGGALYPVSFFVLAAGFFINFHHYFIDAIVWRNPHSKIRPILQSAGRAGAKVSARHFGRA